MHLAIRVDVGFEEHQLKSKNIKGAGYVIYLNEAYDMERSTAIAKALSSPRTNGSSPTCCTYYFHHQRKWISTDNSPYHFHMIYATFEHPNCRYTSYTIFVLEDPANWNTRHKSRRSTYSQTLSFPNWRTCHSCRCHHYSRLQYKLEIQST